MNAMSQIVAQNEVAQKVVAADKAVAASAKAEKANKAAAKKAETKPAGRATRPAQAKKETTTPAKSAAVASAKAIPVKFMLNPSIRPGAGQHLFSHTEAVLQALDMYKGKQVALEVLVAMMGATAVAYHEKKGRLIEGKQGFSLTSDGKAHFAKRGQAGNKERFVQADVESFKAIFQAGQADGRLVKNQAMIKPFAPAQFK